MHDLYNAIRECYASKPKTLPTQANQVDVSQKMGLLEQNMKEIKELVGEDFSKRSKLRERELEIKDRELKIKEQQLAEISTVGDLPDVEKNVLVFVSYATNDAELFKIKEIAKSLNFYEDIKEVLYWQENMKDNIIKYMNDKFS